MRLSATNSVGGAGTGSPNQRMAGSWATGRTRLRTQTARISRETLESKVDIIVAPTVAATTAARKATSTIPIVMVHAGNPIGAGLIASLARPGGNVTGTTNMLLGGKQVELIRELVPRVAKLGVLVNPTNAGA